MNSCFYKFPLLLTAFFFPLLLMALEKIELDEIKPSSRKYPYIDFRPEREIGNEVLSVENLSKTINGEKPCSKELLRR